MLFAGHRYESQDEDFIYTTWGFITSSTLCPVYCVSNIIILRVNNIYGVII